MKTIQLVLAFHNHQPVGNFEHVYAEACDRAYQPFLDCMDDFPEIPFVLHNSGCLLDWMEKNRPALVARMGELAQSGRVEMMGGGEYEPIMTMLPERDRVGQVASFSRRLRNLFGAAARGAWLAERVWEASVASSLADAGIEYTVVDDFHFRCAGLRQEELLGYYVTEDQGRTLRVFPGCEKLRYLIPFAEPEKTIEFLRGLATEGGERVVAYADDGEKFGVWPKTYAHVYGDKWLMRFFTAIKKNLDWIRVCTFSTVMTTTPPVGKIYLPDASYREMTEWALPARTLREFRELDKDLKALKVEERVRPFVRGGTWRNFKAKYVEAAQMYARMMEVSAAVDRSRAALSRRERSRTELYRGQCNCAYWHGAFGGLYLPFLRFETYRRLLTSEGLITARRRRPAIDMDDYDLDGRPEARIVSAGARMYVKPDRGGHLYEWDDLDKACNLMCNLTRREEAYHHDLLQHAAGKAAEESAAASIHDKLLTKEDGLEKFLVYDACPKESLVDHVFAPGTTIKDVASGKASELGAWMSAPYACERVKRKSLKLRCAAGPAAIEKTLEPWGARGLLTRVSVAPQAAAKGALYAMEFNVNLLAGDADDRYYLDEGRRKLGRLRSTQALRGGAVALADEWLGVEFWLRFEPEAEIWALPVETVSGSEGGLERVYQGSSVLAVWPLSGLLEAQILAEVIHR
ncbi:MAG TPA: DUF1926 domain-containing protein [Candidatus Brocadiia bacterium]|nr:DUF1926 domain-containing protein [Candidatus Brocadiia bacterium]